METSKYIFEGFFFLLKLLDYSLFPIPKNIVFFLRPVGQPYGDDL